MADETHDRSRRRILRSAAAMVTVVALSPRPAWSSETAVPPVGGGLTEQAHKTLSRMAYHLFPHDGIGAAPYHAAADDLLRRCDADPSFCLLLQQGILELGSDAPKAWLDLPVAEQLTTLRRLQDSAFFKAVRVTIIESLYRNRSVWQLVGYQGSSVEHGGYVDRGFDDIAWLPATGDDE